MVITSSDASFNITGRKPYGQSGVLAGLRIIQEGNADIYNLLDWMSINLRRICCSSSGAEILACAEDDDRSFYIRTAICSILPSIATRNELVVDSMGLYDTVSTLHERHEYGLRQTVQRIRDSFEGKETDIKR